MDFDLYILLLQLNEEWILLKQKGNQRPVNLKTFYKVEGLITWKLGNSSSFEWRKDHGIIIGNLAQLLSIFENYTHFKNWKIVPKVRYDYDTCKKEFEDPCPYYRGALSSLIMPTSLALLTFLFLSCCTGNHIIYRFFFLLGILMLLFTTLKYLLIHNQLVFFRI